MGQSDYTAAERQRRFRERQKMQAEDYIRLSLWLREYHPDAWAEWEEHERMAAKLEHIYTSVPDTSIAVEAPKLKF